MSWWSYQSEEDRRREAVEEFGRLGLRRAFTRTARFSLQSRGIDPDLVPSLSLGPAEEPTMTRREVSARAQSLGVSVAQYQAATPEQRREAASVVGTVGKQLRTQALEQVSEEKSWLGKVLDKAVAPGRGTLVEKGVEAAAGFVAGLPPVKEFAGATAEEMARIEKGYQRFLNPTQAAFVQMLKVRAGATTAGGVGGTPIRTEPISEVAKRGVVNPLLAALGDEEEIALGQEVLNELGLLRLPMEVIFDPLNAFPIIGFTKWKDFARLIKGASRLRGPQRTAAVAKLAREPLMVEALEGAAKQAERSAGVVDETLRMAEAGLPPSALPEPAYPTRGRPLGKTYRAEPTVPEGVLTPEAEAMMELRSTMMGPSAYQLGSRNRILREIDSLELQLVRGGKAVRGEGRKAALRRRISTLYDMIGEEAPRRADTPSMANVDDATPGADLTVPPEERLPTVREVEIEAAGPRLTPDDRRILQETYLPDTEWERGVTRVGGAYAPYNPNRQAEIIFAGADPRLLRLAEKFVNVPGIRQVVGVVNRIALAAKDPVLRQRMVHGLFLNIESSVVDNAVLAWKKMMLDNFKWVRHSNPARDWQIQVKLKPGVTGVPESAVGDYGVLVERLDDFTNLDGTPFTREQLAAIDHGKQLQENMFNAQRSIGVDIERSELQYSHRIVLETPAGKVRRDGTVVKRTIGGKTSSEKPRAFASRIQGYNAGYKYLRDPFTSMGTRLHEGIRTIADRNALTNLKDLGVKWSERMPVSVSEHMAADRSALRLARINAEKATATGAERATYETARRNYVQSRRVYLDAKARAKELRFGEIRGPGNRVYEESAAQELREFLTIGATPSQVQQVNLLFRAFRTTMDVSATLVQKAIFPFTHPVIWAKTSVQGALTAMADPLTFVSHNFDDLEEAIRFGAAQRPVEFLFAPTGIASIPTRLPLIGPLFRGSNRAFSWSVVMSELDIWRGEKFALEARLGHPASVADKAGLGAAIQKSHGALTDAALGLTSHQKATETMVLFASRFFRSNVGLITDMAMSGPRGHYARTVLGRFFGSATVATIGLNMAMNNGKLPNLTRPDQSGWFQVRTPKGYVSLFGPFHPFMNVVARDAFYLATDPKHPDRALEPLKNFARAKTSIPFQVALDLYWASRGREESIYGERLPTTPLSAAEYSARQFAPLGLEQTVEGVMQRQYEAFGETAGLRTRPFTVYQKLRDAFKQQTGEDLEYSPADMKKIRENPLLTSLHEDVSRESRERGRQTAQIVYDVRNTIKEEEVNRGLVRLAEAVLTGDALAAANWPEARSDFLAARSMIWEGRLKGREPDNPEEVLIQEYYTLNVKGPQYTEADGTTDWAAFRDAQDAILDQLPPEEAEAIRDSEKFLNPIAEKVDKRFRADLDTLRGYWDVEDAVWEDLQGSYPELSSYNSYMDLFKAKAEELRRLGVPEEELRWRLGRLPILSNIGKLVDNAKRAYRLQHPEADAALIKWGYATAPAASQAGVGYGKFRPGRGLTAGRGLVSKGLAR